jgi:cytochrome c-type biogenesis protein CcsB
VTLAQWSNLLVYASMAVYLLAFVSFAVSFAASRTGGSEAPVAEPVEVLAGATASAAAPAALAAPAGAPTDAAARARAEARARSAQVEAEMAAEARRGRRGSAGGAGGEALPPGRRAANIAMSLTWLAFLLLLAGVVARGVWAGRAPWGNMYEYSLASALAITGVFLAVSLRRDVRWLGLLVSAASLITLGVAVLLLYNDSPQLVPALKSYWLVIHVSAAIISGGAFTVGAAATTLYLVADRAERRPDARVSGAIAARLPGSQALDTLAYRVNAFVFPLWTFAVIAGSIWAEDAWGRYWGWDPKETWAFITWLVYAGYLHARATAGWRGRKAAVVALIGFACFLINFFGVNLFASGLHSYSGV